MTDEHLSRLRPGQVQPIRVCLFDVAIYIAFKVLQHALVPTKVELAFVDGERRCGIDIG
jgi:hypothetical protein